MDTVYQYRLGIKDKHLQLTILGADIALSVDESRDLANNLLDQADELDEILFVQRHKKFGAEHPEGPPPLTLLATEKTRKP